MKLLLPPQSGELLVSVDGELAWPAQVDPSDRWNGWLSPQFRPDVARALARHRSRWVAGLEAESDDYTQDQLVLSPDERTVVHLVWTEESWLQPDVPETRLAARREHEVWLVYDLTDDSGRVAIGAWHWCWFAVDPRQLS